MLQGVGVDCFVDELQILCQCVECELGLCYAACPKGVKLEEMWET